MHLIIKLGYFLSFFIITFTLSCWVLYKKRSSEVIIINFDSVLVNIDHIVKRAKIYVANNSSKTLGDYIGAHILDQEVRPDGIKKILDLQKQFRRLVFISQRHESLRAETAGILNDWGIQGELYMNDKSLSEEGLISLVVAAKKKQGLKIKELIGWERIIYVDDKK